MPKSQDIFIGKPQKGLGAIKASNGISILVDLQDYEYLNQFKWQIKSQGYASRHKEKSQTEKIAMHREIMKAKKGQDVDHINHNILDNRKCNLRLVTRSQNNMNRVKQSTKASSVYKGVTWDKSKNKWQAQLTYNFKYLFLGRYTTQKEAAINYNETAKELFGEFALLNKI